MKGRILFSLLIMVSVFVPIAGQTNADLRQVTLNYLEIRGPSNRFAINFETGKLRESKSELSADFDLTYGGLAVGWYGRKGKAKVVSVDGRRMPTEWIYDWFQVADARFIIVDLGVKKWSDYKETPAFPPSKKTPPPLPLENRPLVIATTPESRDVSPYQQVVQAKAEHMYLMRLRRGPKVIYAMFRVESLSSRNYCVLSWKLVTPPKVDNESDTINGPPRKP